MVLIALHTDAHERERIERPDSIPVEPPSEWDAAVEDGHLRIRHDGIEVCGVPIQEPRDAERPDALEVAVRVDGRFAAVASHSKPIFGDSRLSLLVVDVPRCRPVAITFSDPRPGGGRSWEGGSRLRLEGDQLVHHEFRGALRWEIRGLPPWLVPEPDRGFQGITDVLDADVPVVVGQLALLRLDASAPIELGREVVLAGDELVTIGDDGWRRLSASGAVLASGTDLPISGLTRAVRTADALYVTDGYAWFDLTHRRSVLAPLVDRVVSGDLAGERFVAVDVPDGVRIVGEGSVLGPVIAGRPIGFVSVDGRVLVELDVGGLVAREVAGGSVLWRVEADHWIESLRSGARWVAVSTGTRTTLLNPVDGSPLATIKPGPSVEVGTRTLPLDRPWDVPSGEWAAPVPARSPWHPTTLDRLASAGDALVQALACGRPPGNLAVLAPLITGLELATCRSVLHPARLTAEEAGELGVIWGWRFEHSSTAERLGDGVLVRSGGGIAAFGPDGVLRWSRAALGTDFIPSRVHRWGYQADSAIVASQPWKGTRVPVVVHAANGRVTLVAGRTGTERWSVPAASLVGVEGGIVWLRRLEFSPPSAYSLATGKPASGLRQEERAFGWACGAKGCAQVADAADQASISVPEAVPSGVPSLSEGWRIERNLLLGPSGPAAPFTPPVAPAWTAASARFPVPPTGPTLAVVTSTGVVALGPDGRPRWRAAGRVDGRIDTAARLVGTKRLRPDGWDDFSCCVAIDGSDAVAAGEVVATASSAGVVAKRRTDGSAAWSRPDLQTGRLRRMKSGALVHEADGWHVLDAGTGATLARGEGRLLAVSSGPGPLRVAVERGDARSSILDAGGTELRIVPGQVNDLVSDSRGITWVERRMSRHLACSDVGPGWCVGGHAIASDGERVYVSLWDLVVAMDGDGEVAWAVPVEGVQGMFGLE